MQLQAKRVGKKLLEAERAVDAAFKSGTVTPQTLRDRLTLAANLRAELRLTHLGAHLETAPILTKHQKTLYAQLRGYTGHSGHQNHEH